MTDMNEAIASWTRSVYLEAHATDDGDGPGYARLDVTPAFLSRLQSLRSLCLQHDLTEVRIADAPDEWGPDIWGESFRLRAPELVVTPRMFWFTDLPKSMPFEIETRAQGIDAFVAEVSGPGEPIYLGIEPEDIDAKESSD